MLESGTLLQGRYRIQSQIGKGGMGTVYVARDENIGMTVAVKRNFLEEPRLIEAFKREARLLAGLRHPALPQVKDYFIDATGQYIVMEYIAGDDLGTILQKRKQNIAPAGEAKPFEVEDVTRWAEQLLDALDYLHTRSEPVVHRDIKPLNLKLAERGQIILLDFGLAKGKPLWMTRATSTGSLYGYTPNYAPIEQIRGLGTDPRSDLYALGATLYHLITGESPIDAATRAESFLGAEPDPLPAANWLNPRVPKGLSSLLMKAMEPHRNNRPSSAAEMLNMLRTARNSTVIDWQTWQQGEKQQEEPAELDPRAEYRGDAYPTVQGAPPHLEQSSIEDQAVLAKEELARLTRQEEEERKAREDAELKAKQEAERKAREEAELKAKQEAERKAREEAELKAKQEEERKAREEAERKAAEEAERRRRQQYEEERMKREAAILRLQKELEEVDRKAREEAALKTKQEAERKAQEEAELKAKQEAERKAREE
ncbi:MAG TPA: protein kinase, partial [Blastocatellia bacterium]|nr:protein kinase [Blastocatellia bacterium]